MNDEVVFDYVGSLPLIEFRDEEILADVTDEQASVIGDIEYAAQINDLYTTINELRAVVDRLTNVVSGNTSPDIDIEFDPQTGQSTWRIKADDGGTTGIASLGSAEKEYMVYQRKANDEDENEVYGFDYVRGVPATEA